MFFFLYIGIGKFICKDASPPRRESPRHKKEEGIHLPPFEPLGGLEPPTHALRMRCSTN